MTIEEYQAAINEMVAKPETAATAALNLMQAIKDDAAKAEAYKNDNAAKDETIKTINAQAAKFLISQPAPGAAAEGPDPEPEKPKTFHEVLTEKLEEMYGNDQNSN